MRWQNLFSVPTAFKLINAFAKLESLSLTPSLPCTSKLRTEKMDNMDDEEQRFVLSQKPQQKKVLDRRIQKYA